MKNPANNSIFSFDFVADQDQSWKSKLATLAIKIKPLVDLIKKSRLLQLASVCLMIGLASSFFGLVTLLSDSHLSCDQGTLVNQEALVNQKNDGAESGNGDAESIDFFKVEAKSDQNDQNLVSEDDLLQEKLSESPTGDFGSEGSIMVDVSGAIKKPGVYLISEKSRLGDAIATAGGLTNQANALEVAQILNLASKLADGQKIYVPFQGEEVASIYQRQIFGKSLEDKANALNQSARNSDNSGSSSSNSGNKSSQDNSDFDALNEAGQANSNSDNSQNGSEGSESDQSLGNSQSGADLISINKASASELMELKGIGEKRASDIIAARPYISLEELLGKKVITQSIFDDIEDLISL
jgi:DNA uptake protein ComE-like DNA-binding protein